MLSPDAERFAALLHGLTKLDLDVCRGWTLAEGNGGGPNNWLNVRGNGRSYSGVHLTTASGFDGFLTVDDAATETAFWIDRFSNYAAIRQTTMFYPAHDSPAAQLEAIWKSPWDAGHYGGDGRNLLAAYKVIAGTPLGPPPAPNRVVVVPHHKPAWYWIALKQFLARRKKP